jgi:hypothetical protein
MDGGVATVPNAASTTLFKGAVPPNGFMVRVFASNPYYGTGSNFTVCFVNDNGPAGLGVGFFMTVDQGSLGWSGSFASPHGCKPMGPVSIWCAIQPPVTIYLAARGW